MTDAASNAQRPVLNDRDVEHKIKRIALEILERYPGEPLAFVGVLTRGVTVARRVQEVIADEKPDTQLGSLDISLYRDDLNRLDKMPSLESSDIPFDVDGAHVIIFDEVIYTGRTVRAAIEGILDYGRPSKIELAAFIDRGHRELPIQPDFVGHHLETALGQHVQVRLQEDDGEDAVYLRDAKDHPTEP